MKKGKEYNRYINDCGYIAKGQRVVIHFDGYEYEIGRDKNFGSLYANVILEDDKEIYPGTLELLKVHKGITYNKVHNGKRVIGFDCNFSSDYVPYREENHARAKYKDMAYVKQEVKKLIRKLKRAGIR